MLKSQRGITLIEIMVAMVLFGIGLSMALRTLPDSNVVTTKARNITKATNLAQEQIEHLMGIDYGNADLNAGTHTDADNPLDNHFTRSWVVADDNPVADMKRIDVTVSFQTAAKDSTVTLSTYLTSRR